MNDDKLDPKVCEMSVYCFNCGEQIGYSVKDMGFAEILCIECGEKDG